MFYYEQNVKKTEVLFKKATMAVVGRKENRGSVKSTKETGVYSGNRNTFPGDKSKSHRNVEGNKQSRFGAIQFDLTENKMKQPTHPTISKKHLKTILVLHQPWNSTEEAERLLPDRQIFNLELSADTRIARGVQTAIFHKVSCLMQYPVLQPGMKLSMLVSKFNIVVQYRIEFVHMYICRKEASTTNDENKSFLF